MEEQPLALKIFDALPWYFGYAFIVLRSRPRMIAGSAVTLSTFYGIRRYLILQDHESPEYATEILTPAPLRFAKGFIWAFFRMGVPASLAKVSEHW